MKRISTEHTEPGQIIAKPVQNESGRVLCTEGTSLTDNLIKLLSNWGVNAVYIEADDEDARSPEELFKELDERFAPVTNDAFMMELKELYHKRIDDGTITQ